jgi:hypothetical protein
VILSIYSFILGSILITGIISSICIFFVGLGTIYVIDPPRPERNTMTPEVFLLCFSVALLAGGVITLSESNKIKQVDSEEDISE